jgi:hypothetical protein
VRAHVLRWFWSITVYVPPSLGLGYEELDQYGNVVPGGGAIKQMSRNTKLEFTITFLNWVSPHSNEKADWPYPL